MLAAYRTATQGLLQNPGAPTSLYATSDIDRWINTARGQLAGESESIRALGTLSTVVGQRNYNFSSISTGVVATTGIAGVINVRSILYAVGDGYQFVNPRSWEWFTLYHLNNPVPENGVPQVWSQFKQGSAGTSSGSGATGNLYLDPPPDIIYSLLLDCVCYPAALADDSTVEAIPYLFTDAVPFFAAYYAYLSSQTGARQADAARMYGAYKEFYQRARMSSNPSVNRSIYEQSPDQTMIAKLGLKPQAQ